MIPFPGKGQALRDDLTSKRGFRDPERIRFLQRKDGGAFEGRPEELCMIHETGFPRSDNRG